MNLNQSDFTLNNYSRLLKLIKKKYSIILFNEIDKLNKGERFCLLRHDVDFSIRNAYKLAEIENKLNIVSTYFIQLSSNFYNVFDSEILKMIRGIIQNGHLIGLHFYPMIYNVKSKEELIDKLSFEKKILQALLNTKIPVFSYHNPSPEILIFDQFQYANMVNTYSKYFKESVAYCSDSNGYWRHDRLEDFIKKDHNYIQILTHPVWWQDVIMNPRTKIKAELENRSETLISWYDDLLNKSGRKNF